MSKESYINNVELRGYVFSHTLQERESTSDRTKGQKYISGLINIATDDEAVNVVPVNFYVMELTRKGTVNATFTNLKQIIETGMTYEQHGTDANRVRVSGSIDVNDFYNREGNLVTGKRVRGSFLHFLNANEQIGTNPARFEAEVLLQAAIERESSDGSEYLSLQGFAFNYRKQPLPVTFSISSEAGMNFFQNEDISAQRPYFGKVWGNIVSNVVVTETEADDSNVAFGAPMVQSTTRTFRTWEVVGANTNLGLDDSTITQEELNAGIAEREAMLAELKARTEERNNSAAGKAGFPAAATTKPASNGAVSKDYVF